MKGILCLFFILFIGCNNLKTTHKSENELTLHIADNDTTSILYMFYKIKYNPVEKKSDIFFTKYLLGKGKMKNDFSERALENNFVSIRLFSEKGQIKEKIIAHPLYAVYESFEEGKIHQHTTYLDSGDLIFRINYQSDLKSIEISENFKNRNNTIGSIAL